MASGETIWPDKDLIETTEKNLTLIKYVNMFLLNITLKVRY